MTEETKRPGVLVDPVTRYSDDQIQALHGASLAILQDPGVLCFNEQAVGIFREAGCEVQRSERDPAWILRLPAELVERAVKSAPSRVVLGARDPDQRLVLDADVPRIHFGTGSETNIVLESTVHELVSTTDPDVRRHHPVYSAERGTLQRLCDSARLCNGLENADFFIRNVNVQDPDITEANKDVNIFFASLMYMSKHVQAGLTDVNALDDLVRLGEIVAGGADALRSNPVFSFIACLIKSPLQMVDDTTDKVIEIARRGLPLVISSSPQGGSTAPVQEEGMVAQINAEILAGIALTQLVRPGTPVLYGAVPVRARLDTLHDLYGAPEFIHYNLGCVQLARHYHLPCYSTAGVADTAEPGLRATVEKLPAQLALAQSGAQYIHYAFGLLDRTNIFCPLQAVLDDANIGLIKQMVRRPLFGATEAAAAAAQVSKVMGSSTRLYARHIRKYIRRGLVSPPHTLEAPDQPAGDEYLLAAQRRLESLRQTTDPLMKETVDALYAAGLNLLPRERFAL